MLLNVKNILWKKSNVSWWIFFFFLQKVFIKCLSIKICIIYRFFFQENLIYDITASGGRAWFMLGGGWTTDLRYATENNTKEGWQLMMFKDEQWKCSKGSKKFQKSRKETPWVSPHWIWQKWQIYVRSNHRSIIQTGSGDWKKKTPLSPSVLAVALTCSPLCSLSMCSTASQLSSLPDE